MVENLKTGYDWATAMEVELLDVDGWRIDGTSMETPITRADFLERLRHSTARFLD